jgi:hypothetical protein
MVRHELRDDPAATRGTVRASIGEGMPLRIPLDTLVASPVLRRVAMALPWLFTGPVIHRAALLAAWSGTPLESERLFEAAVRCYRARLDLVPLARLRAHQAMVRARGASARGECAEALEVERRLSRLETIEAPWPPFELVSAASLLATWDTRPDAAAGPGAMRDAPMLRAA